MTTRKSLLIFCALLLLLAPARAAELGRGTSDPYKGDLSIFEAPDRDQKLQIKRVMDLLGIQPGTRVADIGAGSGWFTVRSARRVGPTGLVYAVEINKSFLRHIKRRAVKEKLPNIRTVLGQPGDPLLSDNSVDVVFLLKTYHEIAEPLGLLGKVRKAMRPGARLGIIDRSGIGTDHGLNADVVIKEAAQAGFDLVAQYDFVKSDDVDYFLIFKARD